MLPECLSLRVLISIKSTMIIDGGIAKTLMMQDDLRFVSFYDLDMMDLKALGRFRQKTIKQRTRLKIQLTTYVDQVFPEIQYFF